MTGGIIHSTVITLSHTNVPSRIPHTIKTDTQGCGTDLADTKLSPFNDITLFHTET